MLKNPCILRYGTNIAISCKLSFKNAPRCPNLNALPLLYVKSGSCWGSKTLWKINVFFWRFYKHYLFSFQAILRGPQDAPTPTSPQPGPTWANLESIWSYLEPSWPMLISVGAQKHCKKQYKINIFQNSWREALLCAGRGVWHAIAYKGRGSGRANRSRWNFRGG